VSCAGYLLLPEPQAGTGERLPVAILAHGFSGTMDRLVPHAERFAAAGLAALVFDYRSLGESGGQPRQVVDLPDQRQDLRAAMAWVRGRLFAAIVWDSVKGRLRLEPFYVPMVGKPGELAVTATLEADRHIQTLTGGEVTTLWKNQVAPRGLLQMMRYRPALAAARLQAPLLEHLQASSRVV
jgi:hypothetical protein